MRVHVHIDHLVVHDAPAGLDRQALARAVTAELTRLLTETPADPGRTDVGAVRGPDIGQRAPGAAAFGAQIAAALHTTLRTEADRR